MRRVGLPLLPRDLADWFGTARLVVEKRKDELMPVLRN
jgi:hypothetical protein